MVCVLLKRRENRHSATPLSINRTDMEWARDSIADLPGALEEFIEAPLVMVCAVEISKTLGHVAPRHINAARVVLVWNAVLLHALECYNNNRTATFLRLARQAYAMEILTTDIKEHGVGWISHDITETTTYPAQATRENTLHVIDWIISVCH